MISAESSLMSPWQPNQSRDWTEANLISNIVTEHNAPTFSVPFLTNSYKTVEVFHDGIPYRIKLSLLAVETFWDHACTSVLCVYAGTFDIDTYVCVYVCVYVREREREREREMMMIMMMIMMMSE